MEMKIIQLLITIVIVIQICVNAMGHTVVNVQNKLKLPGKNTTLSQMRTHDIHRNSRRGRSLSALDVHMGGDSSNTYGIGLYYAKVYLGTPPQGYYVHVDTASDVFWVRCAGCQPCSTDTDLNIKLHLYDPASSTTYQKAGCGGFTECPFNVTYLDKDSINGLIVEDVISLPQVTGNFETKSMFNASMKFGCARKLQGNGVTKPRNALDGLIGFGRGTGSAISQLAASKKIKKMFAHCFNNEDGGGIFAIGEVVSPKVKTTPLIPKTAGYKVFLKKIDVGGDFLQLPRYMIDHEDPEGGVELDTGSTLTIFPRDIHKQLMDKILEGHPGLNLWKDEEEMPCFKYMENIDDKFPAVTFHFANSLSMTIYPHDYLLLDESDKNWCVAWMPDTSNDPRFSRLMILGDVALQNKLIIYDLEDETVGWTEFDCSSSIKVRSEELGAEYFVGYHDLSSAQSSSMKSTLIFLSILLVFMS